MWRKRMNEEMKDLSEVDDATLPLTFQISAQMWHGSKLHPFSIILPLSQSCSNSLSIWISLP